MKSTPSGVIIFFILLSHNLLFFPPSATGQAKNVTIKFNNISIKDGLSQSSPNCIFQDSRGLMWIATDDGLNKYDGYQFVIYKPELDNPNSISHSRILTIAEDHSADLWIGTNGGGLNRYDRKTNSFSVYLPGNSDTFSVAGRIVYALLAMPDGLIWTGTENGLSIYNTATSSFLDTRKETYLAGLSGFAIRSLVRNNENIIFAGTSRGLFRIDPLLKQVDFYNHNSSLDQSLPTNDLTALLVDRDNRLWIGTGTGLVRMDEPGVFRSVAGSAQPQGNSPGVPVKALLQDDDGNIWIGTFGKGLDIWMAATGSVVNYSYDHNNPYSLKNNEVLSLFKDFSGIIWIGTNGIDLYNPNKEKFILYDYVPYTREKLVFRNIHPIYEDPDGVLWIGSKTDGLHVLDRNRSTYSRYIHQPADQNSLSSNHIRAIKEYPEGILWIGTEDQGLNKVYLDENRRPYRFRHYRSLPDDASSLSSNRIYAFHIGTDGRLWIGTDNGLNIMDMEQETFTRYLPDPENPNSLSNTTVYAIYGDRSGNTWLATDLGINRYNPETGGFVRYIHQENDENSVIHNEILSFCENRQGDLWIGTYGQGLDRLNPVTADFTHYSDVPLLKTAVIYGILEDETGILWLSTNNGIIKFNPVNREANQFSIEDGLQSNEFNGTSYFKSQTGEMFFGGQYGFNSFYPQHVVIDTVPPQIILSDLQVHNTSVQPGEDSPISVHIHEAREIVLNHKQNNFTLYFSALHYANPGLNQYRYKLEGFDDEWIDVGNKRFVSYTSLPYKTYLFRVIAANSDGVWNETGLSVKIRIKPPFWATLWFRIFLVIAIIWSVVYLVQNRLTAARRQKQIIEEKFRESSKELEEARKQLEIQHNEIVIQKRELKLRAKDQENLLWFNQGLGLFSDIFSKNRDDHRKLCQVTIQKLVDYVDAQQGGIFLLNEEDENDRYLELIANYAYAEERVNQRFHIGEGYVGACFRDRQLTEVDNLTEQYTRLNSGLGSLYLRHLLLVPLKINDICIGVVELGSFRKIKGYRISFIEKLMESFAAILNTEQASARLKRLIEKSTLQSQELEASEEQLRMNLEEIMATQEESSRREDELIKLAEESATREEMLNQEIEKLTRQLEQLTGNQGKA